MKIQINNDFSLLLAVRTVDGSELLTGVRDIEVYVQNLDAPHVRCTPARIVLDAEVARVDIAAKDVAAIGRYLVAVTYTAGDARRYAENGEAFAIVRTAAEADAQGESVSVDLFVKFEASGKNGLSAFELAVQNGYAGTYEEWLAAGENANNAALRAVKAADAAADAAQAANAASQRAADASIEANSAASRADAAADEARSAAELANTSAGQAAAAVKAAQTSTALAEGAALKAGRAATDAADSAGLADDAAVSAHAAAAGANDAAQTANAASRQATDAAGDANSAASRANTAAAGIGDRFAAERAQLENGEVVVGLARELYSRCSSVENAIFLLRPQVKNGAAALKQIAGCTFKNYIDNTASDWTPMEGSAAVANVDDVIVITPSPSSAYARVVYKGMLDSAFRRSDHKYYCACTLRAQSIESNSVGFGLSNYGMSSYGAVSYAQPYDGWQALSVILESSPSSARSAIGFGDKRSDRSTPLYICNLLCVDLTEMFGAGKEPGKEGCDAIFAASGTLPKGLHSSHPRTFVATRRNLYNPTQVITGATIDGDALASVEDESVAVVECSSSSGYVVGYGGDTWSDNGVEVYFSPFDPRGKDGSLYLDELHKDEAGVYTPRAHGFLLIKSPTFEKFSVWLRRAADDECRVYEAPHRMVLNIPPIAQLPDGALPGLSLSGTAARDTLDLENGNYYKRVMRLDMGSISWSGKDGLFYTRAFDTLVVRPAFNKVGNIIADGYLTAAAIGSASLKDGEIMLYSDASSAAIFVRDALCASVGEFKVKTAGKFLYFELATPEVYPLGDVGSTSYILDNGVEAFPGALVPPVAEIRHRRSLAGEIRNFLDRLMSALGGDVITAADKIIAAVQQHSEVVNVEVEGEV